MEVKYHKEFSKNYRKRIASNPILASQFRRNLEKFLINPRDPVLKNHKLVGKRQSFRSFSITGDIRVIYKIVGNEVWLYDIGSHNQVY